MNHSHKWRHFGSVSALVLQKMVVGKHKYLEFNDKSKDNNRNRSQTQ